MAFGPHLCSLGAETVNRVTDDTALVLNQYRKMGQGHLTQSETDTDDLTDSSVTQSYEGSFSFHDTRSHYYHFSALGLEDVSAGPPLDTGSLSRSQQGQGSTSTEYRPQRDQSLAAKLELFREKGLTPELLLGMIVSKGKRDPLTRDFLMDLPLETLKLYPWVVVYKQPLLACWGF